MADYEGAFQRTTAHEGGYVHDPDDAGGETYKGISRRFNPSWGGWAIIDDLKRGTGPGDDFSDALAGRLELQEAVRSFYRHHYWDKFWGDEIPSQEVAEELFDTGVNMGIHRAVGFLQEGLNLLNRNQTSYEDIMEDGRFGPGTLNALKAYLEMDEVSHLVKIMNILQGMHYIEYMRRRPSQEKYARGWLKRVKLSG